MSNAIIVGRLLSKAEAEIKLNDALKQSFPNAYEWQVRKHEKIEKHIKKVNRSSKRNKGNENE